MLFIYLPTVVIVFCYALYYYFTRNFDYWKKRNVLGPKPIPFFGNLKETTLRRKYMGNLYREIYNMYPKEKVIGIYRMTTPALVIRDLDIIKHIMLKDFDLFKDRGQDLGGQGLTNNLFHTDADKWSVLRSRFNPIFAPAKLKSMFHLVNERADIFVSHLEKECRAKTEYEIHSLSQKYTISTIFACVFGVDYDAFLTEVDDTLKTLDKLILTPNLGAEIDMMYPGILSKLNITFTPKKVTHFFQNLVTEIMTKRNGKPSMRGDFMDLIINLRQMGEVNSTYSNKTGTENKPIEITNEIIVAQAFLFYIAGYETSASTMAFLLHNISLYPEIQEKLRTEIDTVTRTYNGEITYQSLGEMKYLEQTLWETLRMYPIVDPLQRKAKVDYKVPGTDMVIEKGQIVLIPVAGIHYDDNHYPNPGVFNPDRFNQELVRTRHPCAFLPFGVGPRNCIGMRFGAIQSRLAVAKILLKFKVETCSNTKVQFAHPNKVLMGPKDGVYLNLIPREHF